VFFVVFALLRCCCLICCEDKLAVIGGFLPPLTGSLPDTWPPEQPLLPVHARAAAAPAALTAL
jgi:hypothetical protein